MATTVIEGEKLVSVERLTRDLASAAITLTDVEARYLVDGYYMMQENRIRSENQVRAMTKTKTIEPHSLVRWLAEQSWTLESQVQRALDKYSAAHPLGVWAREIKGIGPVLSAGLLCHVDITVPSAGSVWRFAGLDPTSKWGKGKKRPHNAAFKTLCWKIGESFVKAQIRVVKDADGNDTGKRVGTGLYGRTYLERKAYETPKNEAGEYAEQAAAVLKSKPDHKQAAIYKTGKLPPGHLHMRSQRHTVKLFLAHYWETGRKLAGLPVPKPYPIQYMGHVHKIEPPATESE